MSRAFDITVASVVSLISAIIHLMSVELFAPESPLYEVATSATHFQAQQRADLWFQILSIWVPLIAFGGIWVWAFIREYRRSASTAARAVR